MAGYNNPCIPEDQILIISGDDDSRDSGCMSSNRPPLIPVVQGNMGHDSALWFQTTNDQQQRSWRQEPSSSSLFLPVSQDSYTTPEALSDELGWNQILRPQPWSSSIFEPTTSSQAGQFSDHQYNHQSIEVEESADNDKEAREKHRRDGQVHVEAERKRWKRIKEKMKELQQLVPNSDMLEQSALLEKTIQYVKLLQFQIYAQSTTGTCPGAMTMVNPSLTPLMMQCAQMGSMALANNAVDQASTLRRTATRSSGLSVLRPPSYNWHGVPYLPLPPAFQFPLVQHPGTSATQMPPVFDPNSSWDRIASAWQRRARSS